MRNNRKLITNTALILILIIFLNYSHLQTANAQQENPPDNSENMPDLPVIAGTTLEEVHQKESSAVSQLKTETRDISPESGLLDIAVSDDFEYDSDVTYGYSEYGIVYDREGEIYIAFFRYDGVFINRYQLSDGTQSSSHPAVAFEGSNNLYIVVWQYDYPSRGDFDVLVRAVSATIGLIGDSVSVSGESVDEIEPDIDCNHYDTSCLIVFTYDPGSNTYIKGRFMEISGTGVSEPAHAPFRVSNNSDNLYSPFIAWGWASDTYMVVWQGPETATADAAGAFTHVYETYQSTGDQYMHGDTYLINPADLSNNIFVRSITYNPVTQKYLVLLAHDWSGDSNDMDLRMVVIDGTAQAGYSGLAGKVIANTVYKESYGDICFMTNAWAGQFDTGPDQVAIVYSLTNSPANGIMTTVITGNGSPSSPVYDVPTESEHVLVKAPFSSFGSYVDEPAVSGSDGSGLYLVSLTDYREGMINHMDIKGMILRASLNDIFLPIILK